MALGSWAYAEVSAGYDNEVISGEIAASCNKL
jgi:hypothetical protein